MGRDAGMRVVGTIRRILLHDLVAKFEGLAPRQVAKIELDVERAVNGDGTEIEAGNLAGLQFLGPAELVPRFCEGERVQLVTEEDSSTHITSIKLAPLS